MRTLVIAPSWVGDLIMSGPLIERLAESGPVDVFLPDFLSPLGQRLPGVAQILPSSFKHGELKLLERWRVAQRLRGNYDQAYILPNSLKSALIPAFAGIPHRIGFKGEMRFGLINDIHPLDKAKRPRLVDRYFSLIEDLPSPKPRLNTADIDPLIKRFNLSSDRPRLVLCPGAEYGPAKQWPLTHFAEVGKKAREAGMEVWVLGGPKDAISGRALEIGVPGLVNLASKTSLDEAVDLIHAADAVVTNDSGLMHVAAAVGTPLIALFGSSSPDYTPPLSDTARILSLGLSCSPCFKRTCPLGHTRCLQDITSDQVIELLAPLPRMQGLA